MQFVYAAKFARTAPDEIVVSFRDVPECLTSGIDEHDAFAEATDALEEAIAGRIDDGESIPVPTARRADEREIAVPPAMAAKAALALALRQSGVTCKALARALGIHEEAVGRMVNPRHDTPVEQINTAMRTLGKFKPD